MEKVDVERVVVTGLQSLKALGDAVFCIAGAGDSAVLDEKTLQSLGALILSKSEEVFEALKGWVI